MQTFDSSLLCQMFIPSPDSHKGQNGKLLIVGGSSLFHAAPLWALTIASKIVDMVFFASTSANNAIVAKAKEEFRNGIVISQTDIDAYAAEADVILLGPGMVRSEAFLAQEKPAVPFLRSLADLSGIADESMQTYVLTEYLLRLYPEKKFVIDAGALQMMDANWLVRQKRGVILTPHKKELAMFLKTVFTDDFSNNDLIALAEKTAKKYHCTILLKGQTDTVTSGEKTVSVVGGNAGMTKGGTGDVLAGLTAALFCKNEEFLTACVASYVNKKAGESLANRVGNYFNASDLAAEIPRVLGGISASIYENRAFS